MNYLAHLTLSYFSADLQVGNYLGDLVKGRRATILPPEVYRGVLMHRDIDRLTDADPDVRALNAMLRTHHGRYASVVTDIALDHFLSLQWPLLGPVSYASFCRKTYANLNGARGLMPARVQGYVDSMTGNDWLQLYTTEAGMSHVFQRLRRRLSKPELLDGIDDTLRDHAGAFNHVLTQLFPRLQTLADTYRE